MKTRNLSLNFLSVSQFIKPLFLSLWLACFSLVSANAQSLITTDFNREYPWLQDYRKAEKWTEVSAKADNPSLKTKVEWGKFGVLDVAYTTLFSDALQLVVENAGNQKNWTASLNSGLLLVKNTETNLGKLTLSFDHSASFVRPIIVRVESFNANKVRTGGLEKTVYPATANHFVRSAFELADMKAVGDGKFNPKDPYVNFGFSISQAEIGEAVEGKQEMRIDNFSYSTPAYYVSSTGSDKNDGRTEKTAFANPQAALDKSKPGDIILLMNGSYAGSANQNAVANFKNSGMPASWITLKNYPGHKPTILCVGKDGVRMIQGTSATRSNSPILAYLEVRGLHLKGNSEEVLKQKLPELGTSTPITETTGVNIIGEYSPVRMYHHIRIADCIAEYCGADGIYADYTDYLTVENNILRYNCYTSAHWCMSGFTMMHYADFDKLDNVTKILVRGNEAYANQCKTYKKSGPFKIYNGNGFLFDASAEEYLAPDAYLGRTLVQSNLAYGNGGGGIQMWGSHRIDVVNNTMYFNGITPELKWGNMGFDYCKDIRVINNIVVAQPDRPLDFWEMPREDRNTSNIVRINNLYFGGIKPNIKGIGDLVGVPLFVNPSIDPKVADFRLKPGSPAINAGYIKIDALPIVDVSGKSLDSKATTLNRGAYQY